MLATAAWVQPAFGGTRPSVSFVRATIADSAKGIQQRAFDVLLKDAVEKTHCLEYVNTALRDSAARAHLAAKEPFTFKELHRELDVRYGAYFAVDRYGYLVRLATRIVDGKNTVLERNDLALLQAIDTLEYSSAYEGAMRRMLKRVADTLAMVVDSACPVRVEPMLPVVVGAVVLHKIPKGFGMFLSDNATRICNLAMARMSDSLRWDKRFLSVDLSSRDLLYSRLGEFGIQNTSMPSTQEVALMGATGIPVYLVAEIDSADNYRKIGLTVYAYSTATDVAAPLCTEHREVEPELEQIYRSLNELAYVVANKCAE